MSEGFDTLLSSTLARVAPAAESQSRLTFAFAIPAGMEQGRATFGGFVLGALTRAMRAAEPDPARRLRTLSGELVGAGALGPATIEVAVVRRGSAVSTWQAELRQGDDVLAHATGVFAAPRPTVGLTWRLLAPPPLPPWREVPVLPSAHFAPSFTRHFEYRVVEGIPFTGAGAIGAHPVRTGGYVRPRVATALRDDAVLVALADAWWIAAMVALPAPRPMATLTFELELHADYAALDPEAPLYHRGEVHALTDGYASETRELWTPDGELVSLNRQLVAIIK